MASFASFEDSYETEVKEVAVGGRRFRFFVPRTLEPFLDTDDLFQDFPLWAKIWEASMVLADYLASRKVDPDQRFLEIGCGIGLVGIVAAAFGHRVTLTESNPDALNFAAANAQANLPAQEGLLDIRELDWSAPRISADYDCIVGSEVIYRESDFEPLRDLFQSGLKPEGEVILAEGMRKTSMAFFSEMTKWFDITGQKKTLRSPEKEVGVLLCRMRPKTSP